jgi:hypothetical protein
MEMLNMGKTGKTGASASTPKNILFGAGTIHKGLKYTGSSWNFDESIIGATQGGSKVSIKPEFKKIEVDGAMVAVKGLQVKTGETATMEVNFIELTKEIMQTAVIGQVGTSEDAKFDLIESKAMIEDGDYLENVAFVGQTLDGRNIIVIMDNVLCTSGFEADGKNKEEGVFTFTFECHADLTSDLDKLPYHIYYPKATA